MVNFFRLIFLFFFLIPVAFCDTIPATGTLSWGGAPSIAVYAAGAVSTVSGGIGRVCDISSSGSTGQYHYVLRPDHICSSVYWYTVPINATVVPPYSCPSNYVLSGTFCTSSAPVSGCPSSGSAPPFIDSFGLGGVPNSLCIDVGGGVFCEFNTGSVSIGLNNGTFSATVGKSAGKSCSTTNNLAVSVPNPEQNCLKSGQGFTTVGGITSCISAANNSVPINRVEKVSVTNTDGSVTTTLINTSIGGSSGGSVTSTSTSSTTGGTSTSPLPVTTSTDQSASSFCQKNPNDVFCKGPDKSFFGGSCSAFSCGGDAIQCAIAREQHQRNCALFDQPTSLSDLGNSVASGTENLSGSSLSSSANRSVVDLNSTLDTSKFLSGGCPADRVISLWGSYSVTLPFSSFCLHLQFMGNIVVAFSLLAASRLVGVV